MTVAGVVVFVEQGIVFAVELQWFGVEALTHLDVESW
jgi:hypothetical protein